jgi:hypothetical protein
MRPSYFVIAVLTACTPHSAPEGSPNRAPIGLGHLMADFLSDPSTCPRAWRSWQMRGGGRNYDCATKDVNNTIDVQDYGWITRLAISGEDKASITRQLDRLTPYLMPEVVRQIAPTINLDVPIERGRTVQGPWMPVAANLVTSLEVYASDDLVFYTEMWSDLEIVERDPWWFRDDPRWLWTGATNPPSGR